jgi:rhodanese-related sulfurtransferase
MSLFDKYLWWLPLGTAPELSCVELAELLASEPAPLLIDMRTAREFDAGHIAGAQRFGLGELKAALEMGRLEIDGRPCVAICLSAHRSIPAVRLLLRHGYADARQLAGGMRAWWKAGLPTE